MLHTCRVNKGLLAKIYHENLEIIVIVLVTPKAVSTKLVVVVMGRLKLGAWKIV